MARLYCERHGREHEAKTITQKQSYRQESESVLMTSGVLNSGPWLCDRCSATLDRGDTAYLFHPFTAYECEHMERYDFGYERRYFAAKSMEATVHGRRWPGTDTTGWMPMPARSSGEAKSARREPLCALDLLTPEKRAATQERWNLSGSVD